MSRLVDKVKSHLPHHEAPSNPQPNLVRTYHTETTSKAADKVTFEKEDHFQGKKGHIEEKIIQKETVISDLPKKQPIQQETKIEKTLLPPSQPILPSQAAVPPLQKSILDPIAKTIVEKPVIVKERFVPEEMIEIQPVIHRDRELKEVHEVIQPMREKQVMATRIVEATLANEIRAPIVANDAKFQVQMREANGRFVPSTEYATLRSETIQKPAIIEERIHKTIIEEVQPVLYKETVVPVLIKETQPIYEKIIEAPIVFNEEREVRELGTRFVQTNINETQRGIDYQQMGFNNLVYQNPQQLQPVNQPIAGQAPCQQPMNKVYEKKVEVFEQKIPLQPNVNSTKLV